MGEPGLSPAIEGSTIMNPKLSAVEQVEAAVSTPISDDDPFDLSKLRLTQDFVETGGVKKLLTTIPVR
jgi:hypothetical protein